MRFPFFRNRDSVKNGILISIRRTGDGFHPGLFTREEVLDLDNYKEYDLFLNRILEMQNEIECDAKNRMPVFSPEQQRAVYFDYYKKMYHISVIMYTFSKDCAKYGTFRTGEDLAQQKKLEKALNIAYHEKQICVSQKKCIKDLKVWYNGEDEVI